MIDFNISSGDPLKTNDVSLLLQQIDILFDTSPRDVLGSPDFGTTYDDYLYRLKLSGDNIKSQVMSDLNSLDLLGFTPSVDVQLLVGTERDIALVDIVLEREDEKYRKIYKIK